MPVILDTLVFDEGQITCPTNGLNPKWGGVCHSLSGNAGRTVAVIKYAEDTDNAKRPGGRMDWNHKELAATLRAEMSGHPPVVVLEDENEADSNDGEKIF